MKFGLIGYPLGHSFSQVYFTEKFRATGHPQFTYDLLEVQAIEEVMPLLHDDYFGLNVTIPYKTKIITCLNQIDTQAFEIGAVNTLVKSGFNSWKGYNTDASGFRESLLGWFGDQPLPARALVLGTGGASKAVTCVLNQLDIDISLVSRSGRYGMRYEDIDHEVMRQHKLIINTTPLGMAPGIHSFPSIPYPEINSSHWLYDLVYNPVNTLFLTHGAAAGAKTKNGLEMLHLQADHAWTIWKTYGKF